MAGHFDFRHLVICPQPTNASANRAVAIGEGLWTARNGKLNCTAVARRRKQRGMRQKVDADELSDASSLARLLGRQFLWLTCLNSRLQ
jgi:hypothetical protein